MAQRVNLVEHAVLGDRLSVMRDRRTPHSVFRQAVYEASAIMAVLALGRSSSRESSWRSSDSARIRAPRLSILASHFARSDAR